MFLFIFYNIIITIKIILSKTYQNSLLYFLVSSIKNVFNIKKYNVMILNDLFEVLLVPFGFNLLKAYFYFLMYL